MSSPSNTPRRSSRGASQDQQTPSTSRRGTRGASQDAETPSTSRRGTRGASQDPQTPLASSSRRGTRGASQDQQTPSRSRRNTPSKRNTPSRSSRNTPSRRQRDGARTPIQENGDEIMSDIAPLPSSSVDGFNEVPPSSPYQRNLTAFTDIDLSSPLHYGTPSSANTGTPRSNARGTPIRHRTDIRNDRRMRQVAIGNSDGVSTNACTV